MLTSRKGPSIFLPVHHQEQVASIFYAPSLACAEEDSHCYKERIIESRKQRPKQAIFTTNYPQQSNRENLNELG